MTLAEQEQWERRFARFLDRQEQGDAAHDRAHVRRVVAAAKALADEEGAALEVVLPAAWLHDCVAVPKDAPGRSDASAKAATAAGAFLNEAGYSPEHRSAIQHAIEAHSFSAGLAPETLEAKVVQDADRLDALGAVGIARCLMVGGQLGHALYDPDAPFSDERPPHEPLNDDAYVLDHFYTKLLTLAGTMQTAAGRAEAERRTDFMKAYLHRLRTEIDGPAVPAHIRS